MGRQWKSQHRYIQSGDIVYKFDPVKEKHRCIEWIRELFEYNPAFVGKNAVLGMSGGKDSTIAAALIAEAIGPDRVIGIAMPDKNQGINEADEICKHLGIRYMCMPDLNSKIDARTVMHCLRDFRDLLPAQPVNVSLTKIVNKIKATADFMDRPTLEMMLKPERARVRRFVFSALEGETVQMSPKIAYIIASHVESMV